MEKTRVLHVVTKMDAAGIETLLMNFYRNIDRNKVQFDFLTHRSEAGFYDNEIIDLGGKIYSVPPINPLKHQNYLTALKAFFNEHKGYRVIQSHINTYSMYPLRSAMYSGIPVRIAHSHISNVPLDLKTPFRIYTRSKLKMYSTHNFACSEMAGKWLYGASAITKKNFKIINNSINSFHYKYNEEIRIKVRKELGLVDKFVLGHIGRFNKQKNHDFLIDIFAKVHSKRDNAVLLLIGDGELRYKIEKKAIDLGLQNNIIFVGVRSDVSELLQAMDVFVFPSLFEGLGMVLIEAQAAGLHSVVADTIPQEAFITNLIEKLSLNSPAQIWAEKILDYSVGYKKRDTFEEVKVSGYDIAETTKWLEEFYLRN